MSSRKVEHTEFPNLEYWPVIYCPGHYVIYITDIIIPDLYTAVNISCFLWLNYINVTALHAANAGNITHSQPYNLIQLVTTLTNGHEMYKIWKVKR